VIPAIIVGALTAWYLGLRAGLIVAGVTAVALLLATFIPGMSITVYALVLAWGVAPSFFCPQTSKAAGKSSLLGGAYGQASSWARKFMGNSAKKG
jgi:hypothetical protein